MAEQGIESHLKVFVHTHINHCFIARKSMSVLVYLLVVFVVLIHCVQSMCVVAFVCWRELVYTMTLCKHTIVFVECTVCLCLLTVTRWVIH